MKRRAFITVTTGIGTATLAGCSESTNGNGNDNGNGGESNDDGEETVEKIKDVIKEFNTAWLRSDSDGMREHLHDPRFWPSEGYLDGLPDVDLGGTVESVEISHMGERSEDQLLADAEDTDMVDEDGVAAIMETETWACQIDIELSDDVNPTTDEQRQRVDRIEGEGGRIVSWQDGRWRIIF